MTTHLKNCPFCDGEPISHGIEPHKHTIAFAGFTMPDHKGSHVIECARCECGMIGDTQEEVVAAWNRRPQDSEPLRGLRPEEAKATDGAVLTDWIDVEVCIPEPEVFVLCWNGGRTFVEWFGSKHPREFGVTHWQPYKMPPGATSDMHDGKRALSAGAK